VAAPRGVPKRTARSRTSTKEREAPQTIDEAEVTVEIESLANVKESINILLHGPSGHGKTTLAGSITGENGDGYSATFVSTESGIVAAQVAGSTAGLIRTPTWEHVVAAKRLADQRFGPDDWVILDSLTKMQVLMIRWILQQIHAQNGARDLDIPAIQDHQKWQNYFKRFVDALIDAPYNVIFITTEMYREDEEGDTIILPAITGKDYEICNYVRAQTSLNIYYGITTKTSDGAPVRRALFQPVPPYVAAKDRYSALGKYKDVPDGDFTAMAGFVDLVYDSLEGK
jgi:hypothetical protein